MRKHLGMNGDTHALSVVYVMGKLHIGQVASVTAYSQRRTLAGFADIAPRTEQVTRRAIEKWMVASKHLAPGTRRTRYSAIRGFCQWLANEGHIGKDPTLGLPAPKVPRPIHRDLSAEQAAALLAACADEMDVLIVTLGFRMGLRRAEMAALEMGDVDLSGRTLDVEGKGGHRRRLPIPRDALTILNLYIDARGITAGPLLRLRRYPERGVKPVWVGRRFSELAYSAGIKHKGGDGVSHHGMRHALASAVWRRTGDVMVVRDILGHAGLSQLTTYVRSMDHERMRVALDPTG